MFDWLWDQLLGGAWWLVEGITFFTDEMWTGVYALISANTMNNILRLPIVEQVLTATLALGSALVILSLIVTLLKNMIELDGQQNTLVYRRAIFAVIWMSLSLAVFQFTVPIAGQLTQAAASISGTTQANEMAISSNIVSSLLAQSTSNPQQYQSQILKQMESKTFNPALRCQDSQGMCPSGTDEKAHVFNVGALFIAGLMSALVGVLTLVIGIQVARRLLEVMVLKILAPLCASSWISDPQAQRARQWQKMAAGVLLATAGQMLALSLGIIVISQMNQIISATSNGAFIYGYILLIIGVMMFVIFSPNTINALVDGQTSMSEGLQELIALGQATNIARGVASAAKGMTGVAVGAAGMGAVGASNIASKAMTGMGLNQLHQSAQQFYGGSSLSSGGKESQVRESGQSYQSPQQSNAMTSGQPMITGNGTTGIIPNTLASMAHATQVVKTGLQHMQQQGSLVAGIQSGMNQSFQASQQGLKGVTSRVARKIDQTPPVQTAKYGAALMYAQTLSKQTAIQKSQTNHKNEGDE